VECRFGLPQRASPGLTKFLAAPLRGSYFSGLFILGSPRFKPEHAGLVTVLAQKTALAYSGAAALRDLSRAADELKELKAQCREMTGQLGRNYEEFIATLVSAMQKRDAYTSGTRKG